MEIVNDSVELIIKEGLKKIELIGKVCTKKEHNITENSYINFVKNRIKDGHTSILARTMDMWVGESIENNINGIIIKENKGFIPQRSAKCAHPQIKRLSDEVYTLLKINYSKYYDF